MHSLPRSEYLTQRNTIKSMVGLYGPESMRAVPLAPGLEHGPVCAYSDDFALWCERGQQRSPIIFRASVTVPG